MEGENSSRQRGGKKEIEVVASGGQTSEEHTPWQGSPPFNNLTLVQRGEFDYT